MVRKNKSKRKYARKRKTLTKGAIYSRTSAKSQARQIHALNRKIRTVYKNCMPDLETATCWAPKLFSNQSAGINSTYMYAQINPGAQMFDKQDGTIQGLQIPRPEGNLAKIFGGYLKVSAIYSNNYYQQNDAGNCNRYATVRILALFRRAAFNTNPANTDPSSYISDYSASGIDYQMNHLRPLRQGIANECKILYDSYKTIDEYKPKCEFKIKIPRFNQSWMENDNYPKKTLQIYIMVDGLTMDAVHSSYVANVEVNALWKVNYCFDT